MKDNVGDNFLLWGDYIKFWPDKKFHKPLVTQMLNLVSGQGD